MYVMTERPVTYNLYRRVHGEMAEDDPPDVNGKPIERFYIEQQEGNVTDRFFPKKRAGKEEDPTLQQLRKVECRGAQAVRGARDGP